jgi:hypothetical protein
LPEVIEACAAGMTIVVIDNDGDVSGHRRAAVADRLSSRHKD